jgi:signal transduction histidine kinase
VLSGPFLDEPDRGLPIGTAQRAYDALRRPLAVASAYAELLRDEVSGPQNSEQRGQLQVVLKSLRAIGRQIEDLHDTCEMLSGGALEPGAHDLERILYALAADYEPECNARRALLEVQSDGPLVHPRVDRRWLERALRCLLDNALAFGGDGNRVTLRLARDGERAHLSVLDRGPGIGPDAEPLFACFRRGPDTCSPGLGIGLALARASVLALGGELTAANREGGGARFDIALPLASEAIVAAALPSSGAREPDAAGLLLADDPAF